MGHKLLDGVMMLGVTVELGESADDRVLMMEWVALP